MTDGSLETLLGLEPVNEPGGFGAIYADPPWRFATYSEKGRSRCPDWKHYETMTTVEIAGLPVHKIAAPDACLFLWISWPMLEDALFVIRGWGFTYKTCAFAWLKADVRQNDMWEDPSVAIGAGYWTRANSEVCLLATRGNPKRLHADVRQGIIAPRREHSRKPDGIHARIERLVAGPYLEMFARQTRPGWTCWGNEVQKFKAAE